MRKSSAGDGFGLGLALDGDVLAVGAKFEASGATGGGGNQLDTSAKNSGAAYLFAQHAVLPLL